MEAGDPSKHKPQRHTAPLPFVNPTHALYKVISPNSNPDRRSSFIHSITLSDTATPLQKRPFHPAVTYRWTSRNNRKGRHAVSIDPNRFSPEESHLSLQPTTSWHHIVDGILRMFTRFPVWDISYDVATMFTLGSVVWVINAFFVWLPISAPSTEFKNEVLYGGGLTAFIGASIFEIGSVLLLLEAVNESRTACFGWALERAASSHNLSPDVEKSSSELRLHPSPAHCSHHHPLRNSLLGNPDIVDTTLPQRPGPHPQRGERAWTWIPTISELRTHYLRDLGFLASLVQLMAASVFWISGFTALPGIYDHLSRGATLGVYWAPQVVGGAGFILSGALFMLETQQRWYRPALRTLGWWIGAWNLAGGVGFTLCPAFGIDEAVWAQSQASLSTFWGSWAFLIGSGLQWYESLDKYPVDVKRVGGS